MAKDIKVNTDDNPSKQRPSQVDRDAAAATMGFASAEQVPPARTTYEDEPTELKETATEQAIPGNTSLDEKKPIPRNMLDGFSTKMEVNFVDSEAFLRQWHPHWFNDEGPRIHQAQASGYEFVKRDEITGNWNEATDSNNDPGENVRRYVGADTRGRAMHAYLMKKPMYIHDAHRAEYDARVDRIADTISAGDANRQPNDGRYTADSVAGKSALPKIRIEQQTLQPRQTR